MPESLELGQVEEFNPDLLCGNWGPQHLGCYPCLPGSALGREMRTGVKPLSSPHTVPEIGRFVQDLFIGHAKERLTDTLHLLVSSLNGHNSQDWAKFQSGNPSGPGPITTGALSAAFPSAIAGIWIRNQAACTQPSADVECWHGINSSTHCIPKAATEDVFLKPGDEMDFSTHPHHCSMAPDTECQNT